MELEHVIYEVSDAVAVITLNRPEAANAQSHKVLEELDRAWQAADRDPAVRVIVLKSNGKHFSAGHDMSSTKGNTERVEWHAASANKKSLAVAERLGMTREGVLRQNHLHRGVRQDTEVWSILAPEWAAATPA